jgi:hypothetical protein
MRSVRIVEDTTVAPFGPSYEDAPPELHMRNDFLFYFVWCYAALMYRRFVELHMNND